MNYFNIQKAYKKKILKKYPYWFWAIDLHDTIFKADYQPGSVGGDYFPQAKEVLQLLTADQQIKLILFSSSAPATLEKAQARFKDDGIIFDYVNENPDILDQGLFGQKFFMDVLLDDKAGFEAETDWQIVASEYQKTREFFLNPIPTVDIICYNDDEELLLIMRKNEPVGWALPGGFIDYGEPAQDAAARELAEETGIHIKSSELTLSGVYSDPRRDPRQHTLSITYSAQTKLNPQASDDAADARWFKFDSLPELVFDHQEIITDWLTRRRKG